VVLRVFPRRNGDGLGRVPPDGVDGADRQAAATAAGGSWQGGGRSGGARYCHAGHRRQPLTLFVDELPIQATRSSSRNGNAIFSLSRAGARTPTTSAIALSMRVMALSLAIAAYFTTWSGSRSRVLAQTLRPLNSACNSFASSSMPNRSVA